MRRNLIDLTNLPGIPLRLLTMARALSVVGPLALCGCQGSGDVQQGGPLVLHACRIQGVDTEVRCGDIEVPEQRLPARSEPGRTIRIHFAVIRALARGKHLDPIFVFAGGPGQAATSVGGLVQPLFGKLNRERDIVLVDQRGTGGSNPLQCDTKSAGRGSSEFEDPRIQMGLLAHCATELSARGNDLTQYTTPIAVQDFEAVRERLGYDRINLWGASYGTRVALEYLRQFGSHVRSATLDGVAPATMKLPVSAAFDADQALDRLIADCRADPRCSAAQPNLATRVDGLFARLAQGAIETTIVSPLTGRRQSLEVTRAILSAWVRAPLYTPITASLLPDLVLHAAQNNFSPLLTASEVVTGDVSDGISFGMHLSVVCSEDMTIVTPGDIASLQTTRFGSSFFDEYKAMCAQWPVGRLTPEYFAPVHSDVPVLLLSGGLDPATPPRHVEPLLAGLSQAKHLIAPNLGHGISPQGCAPELIDQFIRSTDAGSLDATCLKAIPRPPFFEAVAAAHP